MELHASTAVVAVYMVCREMPCHPVGQLCRGVIRSCVGLALQYHLIAIGYWGGNLQLVTDVVSLSILVFSPGTCVFTATSYGIVTFPLLSVKVLGFLFRLVATDLYGHD